MTIEQTIEIPANYRILLELPRTIPVGVKARLEISIPAVEQNQSDNDHPSAKIEDIRLLLQREMAEMGTSAVSVAASDGWEAHVSEHYAEP